MIDQDAYDTLEQFYVNYAGGDVANITFDKKETNLPENERQKLQEGIIKNYGIKEPSQHYGWVSKNALGPVFVYRTDRDTQSKLYPAMNVTIDGDIYTVGTAQAADVTAVHYFVLGSNGSQIDFINKQPYSTINEQYKEKVNAALQKMIAAIGGNGEVTVKTQVLYSDTPFTAGTYPEVKAEESVKEITFKK